MWHFLFPTGSTPGEPDEMFADQYAALIAAGHTSSLCPDSVLAGVKPLRAVSPGSEDQAVVTVPAGLLPEIRRLLATHKTPA